jgi:hypothetical protein
MRQGIIVLVDQPPHGLQSLFALLLSAQEKFENPTWLENDGKVRVVSGMALVMCGCHDSHEGKFAVEAKAPSGIIGVLGNVTGPWLGIQLAQALEKGPEEFVVVIHAAIFIGIWCKNDERCVEAVAVGFGSVGKDRLRNNPYVLPLGDVLRLQEDEDEVVFFVPFGRVDAREGLILVYELCHECFVGLPLPRVFSVSVLDFGSDQTVKMNQKGTFGVLLGQ